MNNNESLDSMARRYKDEMMRLYHSGGGSGTSNTSAGQNNASRGNFTSRQVESGQCRFMSAEEIIGNQGGDISQVPMPIPSPYNGEQNMNNMGNNLAASGSVNMDSNSHNSSGEDIFVPYNADAGGNPAAGTLAYAASENDEGTPFRGIMVNSAQTGNTDNASMNDSEIYSELLPAFEFPADLDDNAAVPARISPGFIILGSWTNLTGDNGWGLLQFEVTTGSLGNPVQAATVVVSRFSGNRRILTRILTTGYSGLTKSIYLPAPRYTCGIGWSCTSRPFAEYKASVFANGYYPVTNISVMVEAGIKSVQPVDMVPLPSMGNRPGIQPRSGD